MRAWQNAIPGEPVFLSYCGEDSPASYGLRLQRLPTTPQPCPYWAERYAERSDVAAFAGDGRIDHGQRRAGSMAAVKGSPPEARPAEPAGVAPAASARAAEGAVSHAASVGGLPPPSLPAGLYAVDAAVLQGAALRLKGPWSDACEETHATLLRRGMLNVSAASPIVFGRLLAKLRRTTPLATVGGSLLVWRLADGEQRTAQLEDAAEVVPSASLSQAMREHQRRELIRIVRSVQRAANE